MNIFTIIGARPQFIKAAVVLDKVRERKCVHEVLIHTGQQGTRRPKKGMMSS